MRLWAGLSTNFIRDSAHNQIAEKLKVSFFAAYRYDPPPSEVQSWRNSLRAVAQVLEEAQLEDHGVILEYRLPLTSRRLDCLVCGRDGRLVRGSSGWSGSSVVAGFCYHGATK